MVTLMEGDSKFSGRCFFDTTRQAECFFCLINYSQERIQREAGEGVVIAELITGLTCDSKSLKGVVSCYIIAVV